MNNIVKAIEDIITVAVAIIGMVKLSGMKFRMSNLFLAGVFFSAVYILTDFIDIRCALIGALGVFIYRRFHTRRETMSIIGFSIFSYLCSMAMSFCALSLMKIFTKYSYDKLTNQSWQLSLVYSVVAGIFSLILISLIARFIRKFFVPKMSAYPKEILIMFYLCIIFTICGFALDMYLGHRVGMEDTLIIFNAVFILGYVAFLLVIVFFTTKAFTEKARMDLRLSQYNSLMEYTSNMEQINGQLSSFKHDYINIMGSMTAYLEEEDYEGLKNYFSRSIMPLNQKLMKRDSQLNHLRNLEIPEIKGLIAAKLTYASELGISVSIEIFEKIDEVAMDLLDLSRIIGIYLDNATEAAIETAQPQIQMSLIKNNASVVLIISNTFTNQNIPIVKMSDKGFSTKGEMRGLGLYNVNEILKEYQNVLRDTRIENDHFVQYLEIMIK